MQFSARRGGCLGALGLAVLLGSAALPGAVAAQTPASSPSSQPGAVISTLDRTLLDVMQHAKELGYRGRYAELEPVVRQAFDIADMTRIAIGSGWPLLSPAQQDQLTDAFGKFITATYARRFDGYSGETFEVLGEKPIGLGVLVETRLIKQDGQPIILNYVTRQNEGRWQIVDIFLTGTISELAQRRSEFSAVFEHAGFDGLLSALLHKIAQAESEAHLS